MKKILIIFGTRPEIIKLAPIIHELKSVSELKLIHTGQHKELAEPLFRLFNIQPDIDLDVMVKGQNLFDLTTKLLHLLRSSISEINPDYVMVQGDTTSSYLAALSAFYLHIPVLHVEAGLRSHSLNEPFPEELNRRQISGIASYHFAATEMNKRNLLNEGIAEKQILVTGNTVVDALKWTLSSKPIQNDILDNLNGGLKDQKTALLTVHRRENHGNPLKNILKAAERLLEMFPNLNIIMPVHPNPEVQNTVKGHGINSSRFNSIPPVSYEQFVRIIQYSEFILTDSGGLQEEGAALGKKVFVLRNRTERQELLESGLGELVGTDQNLIVERVGEFLRGPSYTKALNIYGDGKAAQRIRDFILDQL